jgi:hypothetical protein
MLSKKQSKFSKLVFIGIRFEVLTAVSYPGNSRFLQNMGKFLPHYVMSRFGRQYSDLYQLYAMFSNILPTNVEI